MSIEALTVTRLYEAVCEALRERILTQQEAPGSPVTEQAIADRFGVARPTAKATLERLVAEGLLRRTAHKTAPVPELTRDDIRDLFDNRGIIEAAATAILARIGSVPPAAVAAQRALRGHASDFARDDIAFHRALVGGQPSPRLARLHALLMGEVELCIGQVQAHHLIDAGSVADQHQRILDAIVAGDPAEAARSTRAHIDGARDALIAHYDHTHGDQRW